jgi:SAM-dependent methyltransferase
MSLGSILGSVARNLNHRFGIQAMLNGEPRPPAGGFDVKGETFLDWAFVCANLPPGPKRALEIGPGRSPIIPAMLALGYDVTAIDIASDLAKQFAGIKFISGDFAGELLEAGFDVIVACSTVEHIGLSGRYGSAEDPEGDLRAMSKINDLLEPDGLLFLTVPMGIDGVHRPFHRTYGRQRLRRLLQGFAVVKSRFLVKEPWGPWYAADREAAFDYPASARRYALGEFLLRKSLEV